MSAEGIVSGKSPWDRALEEMPSEIADRVIDVCNRINSIVMLCSGCYLIPTSS